MSKKLFSKENKLVEPEGREYRGYLSLGSLLAVLILGFLIRIYFVPQFVRGDVLVYAEWGQKFWEYGPKNMYISQDWYYSFPTQPPVTSLMTGLSFWAFDHKHVLAQIHNWAKIIPAAFIEWFYDMEEANVGSKNGYVLLLKLPAILADVGLTLLVYWIVLRLTKSKTRALVGGSLYFLNPVTIFLSSAWGQTESVIALWGMLAFVLIAQDKIFLSIPLFFLSLYTKPTWAIFIPLYLFLLFQKRAQLRQIVAGMFISFLIFLTTTVPFSGRDVYFFTKYIVAERMLPSAKGGARASISAFNFHTVFLKIDRDLDNAKIAGVPAKWLGLLAFGFLNLTVFSYLKKKKDLFSVMTGLFAVGFGSILFLTNMLERYFFVAFVPMIILMVVRPRTLFWLLLLNLIFFLNLLFAFFRRTSDEIGRPFTDNNFLVIRLLSAVSVIGFFVILKMLQFKAWQGFLRQSIWTLLRSLPLRR